MTGIDSRFIKQLRKIEKRLFVTCPFGILQARGDYAHMIHYIMHAPLPPAVRLERVAKVMKAIEKKSTQLAYLYHMEFSGHSKAFVKLCKKAKVQFRSPMLDVGTGVGSLVWWLRHEGRLPKGKVALVDIDQNMIDYAKALLLLHDHKPVVQGRRAIDETECKFIFKRLDGCDVPNHLDELGGPFRTILSALVIQWVPHPEKIIKAIAQSLRPGGEFIFVGEDDPNAVSLTPLRFPLNLSLGKSLGEIIMYCLEADLELIQIEEEPVVDVCFPRLEDVGVIEEKMFRELVKLREKLKCKATEFARTANLIFRQFIWDRKLLKKIDGLRGRRSEIWKKIKDYGVNEKGEKLIAVVRKALPHKMVMLVWRKR